MSEIQNDYVGEILTVTCEAMDSRQIVAVFGDHERVLVPRQEMSKSIKIGDSFDVYIEAMTQNGCWIGSGDKTGPMRLWQKLAECRENESDIEVTIISDEENGLICDVASVIGYMPRREIEESPLATLSSYVGQTMKARILKFSQADGKLIVSHKAAVAEKLRETREKLLSQLKPDQTYEGTVKQILDFGAIVDIGAGVEGLVHRSNLSWGNDDPASVVSIGQKLKVVVLSLEGGKISLGHKQLVEDTWAQCSKSFAVGDVVEGKVTTFANFGAFVRIDGKVEGLIHNSELSWLPTVHQAQQILKLNETVRVRVIGIDEERRRLRLSLRRVDGNPWQQLADTCAPGTRLTCKISGIAEFGLFVDLNFGLRGLIHKNDLPKTSNDADLSEAYHIGDEVECVMLSVDVAKERASLSIKQLAGDSFRTFIEQHPVGRRFDAVIRRIAKFGAFASIGDCEVEGLIHISELSEHRVENVGSIVKVGQTVQVTVIHVDENRRRIGLSMIAQPFEPEEQVSPEESDVSEDSDGEKGRARLGDIFPDELRKV